MRISQFARGWVREQGLLGVDSATRILEVRGTALNWTLVDVRPRVTLLKIERKNSGNQPGLYAFPPMRGACRSETALST